MHAHSQAHERDRPGRPGRRLASQFPPDISVTGWRVAACRKSFRRDAENAVETTALPEATESSNPNLTHF
jgi:hypothetical protein